MDRYDIDPDGPGSFHIEDGTPEEETEVPASVSGDVEVDNVLDELVEVINARDFETLDELLAPDAEAEFLEEHSAGGIARGLSDLVLRSPSLLLTRGDLGDEPVIATWTYDPSSETYDLVGYFVVQIRHDANGEALIERLDYVDEVSDTLELIVEEPDRSELPEWEDWSELDED